MKSSFPSGASYLWRAFEQLAMARVEGFKFRPASVGVLVLLLLLCFEWESTGMAAGGRQVLTLDGRWQIAEGGMDQIPATFDRTVPVPGLVSLSEPAFVEPGPKVADRQSVSQKDPRRAAFWYRRSFRLGEPLPAVAILKVHKAMFGTRVFVNGKLLGDHASCFTPGYFDARGAVKSGENDLIIRVGADRDAVGSAIPSGFDFEKERYIPGIFDSVELILSGSPRIVNVQTAPDLATHSVLVQVLLRSPQSAASEITPRFSVREARTRLLVGALKLKKESVASGSNQMLEAVIPIANCRLWSPESPALYTLKVDIGTDTFSTRFGMRDFRFDPATGRTMLNGKPYFMRGSNITLYRFFEDGECGALPWDSKWVRQLHRRVKDMHWNCLRYCIGFPPEAWYRIADEEGILIQDEFPIWFGGQGWSKWPADLKSGELAAEYGEWMRERWNHPCVVIWDANNETTSTETAPAISQVRGLDLSNRPWDNSYTYPLEPGDVFESHPYHFHDPNYRLSKLASADPAPQGNSLHNDSKHAVVINEYGWLWLNRDGTPTTLTKQLYQNLLGTN
jgi:beta-galactosidase/beta-glucuronidase